MLFTVGLVAVGLLMQGFQAERTAAEADEAVTTYPSRVCSALPAVDDIEGDALPGYFQLLDLGDAERLDDRHDEILDDMLAISEQIIRGSADESEFGELELTIGDWMQHLDQAMLAMDMAYRTGDNGFESKHRGRPPRQEVQRLRRGRFCKLMFDDHGQQAPAGGPAGTWEPTWSRRRLTDGLAYWTTMKRPTAVQPP